MTRKAGGPGKPAKGIAVPASVLVDEGFDAIVRLIDAARQRAYQAVNTALIELYWQIGEHISRKIAAAEWGDGVVDRLAAHIARTQPGLRGFTRPNLFRMRQFYEAHAGADKRVSALLTNAVDTPPHDPRAEQGAAGARVLRLVARRSGPAGSSSGS